MEIKPNFTSFRFLPKVASSDATNIESSIVADADSYVINGRKWWTSGKAITTLNPFTPELKKYILLTYYWEVR